MNSSFLYVFILIVLFIAKEIASQTITWQKEFGGPSNLAGTAVTQTYDEGYALCGFRYAGGNTRYFIIRTNKYGDTLWARDYPGIYPAKIVQTQDSNMVICGYIKDSVGIGGNSYLIKIDRNSAVLWSKQFDGILGNDFRDIFETIDGNLSMIGTQTVSLNPPIRYNMFFVQTDQYGNTLQIREYDSTGTGLTIDEIPGKGFLLTGTSTLITDYSGKVIEEYRNYGSRGAISSIENDGYVFLFRTDTALGQSGIKLVKTDTMLKTIWAKTFYLDQRSIYANDFVKTKSNYILAGQSITLMGYSYGYLTNIGKKGNLIWEEEYPRGNYYVDFAGVFSCKDGGFITLGTTEPKFVGDPDYIATKTDSLGNTQLISILSSNQFNPTTYELFQNYPNPFNPITSISFQLPQSGFVELKVYDVAGKEVTTLVNEFKQSGSYEVKFDGSNFASGVYFYKLEAGEFSAIKKMILIK